MPSLESLLENAGVIAGKVLAAGMYNRSICGGERILVLGVLNLCNYGAVINLVWSMYVYVYYIYVLYISSILYIN